MDLQHTAPPCNTLQHTATHCVTYLNEISSHARALDLEYYDNLDLGCLIFLRHCLQKSPIISGSFAERDLQRMATEYSATEELWI